MAGAGIAVIAIAFYLVPMLLPEDLTAEVQYKANLVRRQREMISQVESIKARIAQDQQRLTQDLNRLLPGDNPSAAGAALLQVLQVLADSNQVEITRKTVLPEQKLPDNLTKVTVQLDMNCTLDQLVRLITGIENYEKLLRVDDLFIQGMRLRNKDEIRPRLNVAGLVAIPAPAAKPAETAAGVK